MPDEVKELHRARELIKHALAAGADEADVYIRAGPATRITLHHTHISESNGWQQGLALRVWCGNRQALLTTNDLTSSRLLDLAKYAVAEAQQRGMEKQPWLSSERAARPFPAAKEPPITREQQRAMLEQLLETIRRNQAPRKPILSACYTNIEQATIVANSRGLQATYHTSNYRIWVWVEWDTGHLMAGASSQLFADLAPETLVQHVSEHIASLEASTGKAPEGSCEVLLPPLAAAEVARAFGMLLTAENVLRDLKPLLKRLGLPVASPAVTLIDDGRLAGGLKSHPFDDEGTPTGTTMLVEGGKLYALLHTLQSAAQLRVEPNGKAMRAALWQQPHSAPSNIYLQAGEEGPDQLQRHIQRGIVVTGMLRPGRLQSATGKFTLVAQGWWVERGERVYPVSGVPLSANIFELLRTVRCCGSDVQFSPLADGAGAPSILIERMQVG